MGKAIVFNFMVALVLSAAARAGAQAPATPAAKAVSPADQACNASQIDQTNAYMNCLQQAQTKLDAALTSLMAQIPTSAKVKSDVLNPDVAADAAQFWKKNFAGLAAAFRTYRDTDCKDRGIAEAGYGMGGTQVLLARQINQTSREINRMKKRYGLN